MIQEMIDLLPDVVHRIQPSVAVAIAGASLLIGLVGARFSRAIISLSLVSAGTVIGLHMPKWFGWGIDPMGTAFGMAIVLGISGYVLTTLWEGIFFAALLAAGAAAGAWMKLAPHQIWHFPSIDWSQTALEIASKTRLSLPGALTTVLPVILGIGATVGALLMVIWQKLGRALFYSLLGMAVFTVAGILAVTKTHADWLSQIPADPWIQGSIFGVLVLFATGIQWLLIPKKRKPVETTTSENKLHVNQFVAKGAAMHIHTAEKRVMAPSAGDGAGGVRRHPASPQIR